MSVLGIILVAVLSPTFYLGICLIMFVYLCCNCKCYFVMFMVVFGQRQLCHIIRIFYVWRKLPVIGITTAKWKWSKHWPQKKLKYCGSTEELLRIWWHSGVNLEYRLLHMNVISLLLFSCVCLSSQGSIIRAVYSSVQQSSTEERGRFSCPNICIFFLTVFVLFHISHCHGLHHIIYKEVL